MSASCERCCESFSNFFALAQISVRGSEQACYYVCSRNRLDHAFLLSSRRSYLRTVYTGAEARKAWSPVDPLTPQCCSVAGQYRPPNSVNAPDLHLYPTLLLQLVLFLHLAGCLLFARICQSVHRQNIELMHSSNQIDLYFKR